MWSEKKNQEKSGNRQYSSLFSAKILLLAVLLLKASMEVKAFQTLHHTASRMITRSRRIGINGVSLSGMNILSGGTFNTQRAPFRTYPALCASTKGKDESNKPKSTKPKSKKIKLRDPKDFNLEALTAEFDKMATREGFDPSTASTFYADDKTFEDEFDYENIDDEDFLEFGDDEDDGDFLDFGGDEDLSMEERIKNAQRDVDLGRVSVPDELTEYSREVTAEDLQKLGFKQETNPFGNDETRRKETFTLITDAMKCSACGSAFQTKDDMKPGFLPQQKYEIQVKLSVIEEAQSVQDKADSDDWSPEDEVEWLLKSGSATSPDDNQEIDVNAMAEEMGLDLVAMSKKKVICKRCHGLQNFGEAPELLRPGWTDEPTLSQEKFKDLLLPLREKPAVIVALVDLFDFSGSILPELDAIAGDNPVIIAANKVDLLPSKMGQTRAESWVRRELEYLGVESIANVGGAVRLVSCKTGFGITQMLAKARGIADDMGCDIYVVGAANAGKSTLINHILDKNEEKGKNQPGKKKRAGNANQKKGAVTASPLPGTTLEFIKIDLGEGLNLYDTPGLLVPGTLTQRLTPAELKMVVPKK